MFNIPSLGQNYVFLAINDELVAQSGRVWKSPGVQNGIKWIQIFDLFLNSYKLTASTTLSHFLGQRCVLDGILVP